jgi:hypothetical protein
MAYGYTIETQKPNVLAETIERLMAEFSLAAVPMGWAVDIVPALQNLPDGFPGTRSKKTARKWRKSIEVSALVRRHLSMSLETCGNPEARWQRRAQRRRRRVRHLDSIRSSGGYYSGQSHRPHPGHDQVPGSAAQGSRRDRPCRRRRPREFAVCRRHGQGNHTPVAHLANGLSISTRRTVLIKELPNPKGRILAACGMVGFARSIGVSRA